VWACDAKITTNEGAFTTKPGRFKKRQLNKTRRKSFEMQVDYDDYGGMKEADGNNPPLFLTSAPTPHARAAREATPRCSSLLPFALLLPLLHRDSPFSRLDTLKKSKLNMVSSGLAACGLLISHVPGLASKPALKGQLALDIAPITAGEETSLCLRPAVGTPINKYLRCLFGASEIRVLPAYDPSRRLRTNNNNNMIRTTYQLSSVFLVLWLSTFDS